MCWPTQGNINVFQVYKDHANVCVSELLVIDFLLNNGEDGACYGLAAPVQDQRHIPFEVVSTVVAGVL